MRVSQRLFSLSVQSKEFVFHRRGLKKHSNIDKSSLHCVVSALQRAVCALHADDRVRVFVVEVSVLHFQDSLAGKYVLMESLFIPMDCD